MKFAVGANISGIEDVKKSLDVLPVKLRAKHWRRVVSASARPLTKAVKSNAKGIKKTGLLARSIVQKVAVYQKGKYVWAGVGPDSSVMENRGVRKYGKNKGKPIRSRPANYAHLVELGTATAAPKPFMRPALDSTKDKVQQVMADKTSESMDMAVKEIRAGKGG